MSGLRREREVRAFKGKVKFVTGILDEIINLLTGGRPDDLLLVSLGLISTLGLIYAIGGRRWAIFYFLVIPFLNWSFGVVSPWQIAEPSSWFEKGIELHPLTLVTGLVFVLRDFVQRNVGQKVLIIMALAIGWSFYYAWPVIALASGIAFAVSELVDWALYTFTKYRLSTRILLSSALASPVDTTIFLYGADLAVRLNRDAARADVLASVPECQINTACEALAALPPLEPGSMLHAANWIVFVIGKMVGAVIVSEMIRRRENAGLIDPKTI